MSKDIKEVEKKERTISQIIKNEILPIIKEDKSFDLNDLKNQISKISYGEKMDYVRTHLLEPDLIKKIETHITNTGCNFTIEQIQIEITNSDFECSHYIKDTGRQNVYEWLQFHILKDILHKKIKKLPAAGKNCKFIENGKITNIKPDTSKSIDFEEKTNNNIIYYFGKYTKETFGGAQDNQAHDALQFLIEANNYVTKNNDNVRFVLLADGEYYQTLQFKNTVEKYLNDKVKINTINSIATETWL